MEVDYMKKIASYEPILKCALYKWDATTSISLNDTIEEMNQKILTDFYIAVEWVLKHYEECVEIISNTINPAQQNIFEPLREYRVLKNGHYRIVRICQVCMGGIIVEEY